MSKIVAIDPLYCKYRRMWKEDRWKFSGELVQLTIRQNRFGLNDQEQTLMDTLTRIIDEHDGKWLDDYKWYEEGLRKTMQPKHVK